jgi:shikimate kinase
MTPQDADRVFLVGISGAGKSSVATVLARRLGWKPQDTDTEVERRTGRTIPWLFSNKGEAVFRGFEQSAVLELAGRPRQVVALGGGAFVNPLTRATLLRRGLVVWLDVDPNEAAERLGPALADEPRPMLGDDPVGRLRALRAERLAAYQQAHLHITANAKSIKAIANEIAATLHPTP